MSKVLVIISNGFEEIEAVSIIDILRRAEIEVTIASVENIKTIGAHNITIIADKMVEEINSDNHDMIVLPGGLPNAFTLAENNKVQSLLKEFKNKDKFIGAICAAPYALHEANVLDEKYTCYPSFEKKISSSTYTNEADVIVDKKVITSKGPATAMQFGLELVKILKGEEIYTKIKNGLLVSNF